VKELDDLTVASKLPIQKVLVVDDAPAMLRFCRTVLRQANFETIVAVNGLQALDMFREHHAQIALVVADTLMPVMDGVTLIQRLRKFDPECKIVLMTGYDVAHADQADIKPQCPLLTKPFSARDLVCAVRNCLEVQEP